MIVQAVGKSSGDAKSTSASAGPTTTNTAGSSAVSVNPATNTTSPIPKSPSYHSNLDQAGGKEFSFTKASLEAVRTPSLCIGGVLLTDLEHSHNDQQLVGPANHLNPFNHLMGSPLRPRDRNAYHAPPSNVQNLSALKGAY